VGIRLEQVIPWGRSFDEYRRMFDLSDEDLKGRILGCADGPASFNSEATERGVSVVSCDPIYELDAGQIERRVVECHDDLIAQVRQRQDLFVWEEFGSPESIGRHRLAVMRRFLEDLEAGKGLGRYVTGALPVLPFEDGAFDLALVSHFLFLYSDRLDLEFHRAGVRKLLQVAREVRIYPLQTLAAVRSAHVEALVEGAESEGWDVRICPVSYEFQRGAREMMRVWKKPTCCRG
jgi:hypothetical protein